MKRKAFLLLIMFIAGLAMPTAVSIIKKNVQVVACDFAEEEQAQNDLKEIKASFEETFEFIPVRFAMDESSSILFENLSRHDNVTGAIFSPPPEQV